MTFLSTPSGWRATPAINPSLRAKSISIHALRVEGDVRYTAYRRAFSPISIHALRVEGDTLLQTVKLPAMRDFYPRPPGGGRPASLSRQIYESKNFYPRPPGGGRRHVTWRKSKHRLISIHALRVEGDKRENGSADRGNISIHALRVEGDQVTLSAQSRRVNFYPRPPGGGRLTDFPPEARNSTFLSTPSGWRATIITNVAGNRRAEISIHALRVEGDWLGR